MSQYFFNMLAAMVMGGEDLNRSVQEKSGYITIVIKGGSGQGCSYSSPVRSLTRYSFLVEELRLISSPINPVRKSMVPRIIAVRAI